MSDTQSEQSRKTKRKHTSPSDKESKTSRRRFLSSSLPDLSEINSNFGSEEIRNKMENVSDTTGAGSATPGSSTTESNTLGQPPYIQSKDQTFSLPELIMKSLSSENIMTNLVPLIAEAIKPTVEQAVQTVFSSLQATIHQQAEIIESQKQQIDILSNKINEQNNFNNDLQKEIWRLEEAHDDLEQYGRRNTLRFHNCPAPEANKGTDDIVISICREKFNLELQEDDIFRSHPIGRIKANGRRQIICRFKNWKIKNSIYSQKKQLKESGIFITEDLTRYRQSIIQELIKGKRANKVHSFWTSDGRIFAKFSERGSKYLIRSIDELHDLAPPNAQAEMD